jgi:chemotaxis protein CheD
MALLGIRTQAAPAASRADSSTASARVVGLGEAKVLRADDHDTQEDCLVAYGLGSCVAVCLWDPATRVAAMAHVVLPGVDPSGVPNPKFARSALPALVSLMQSEGAGPDPCRYVARLAGGAEVLAIGGSGKLPRIGEQNALAVRESLEAAGVPIQATELGGTRGRSVWFDPREGGQIRVRAVGSTERSF